MANFGNDKALSFGKLALIATGNFPDVINLGKLPCGKDHYPDNEGTNVDRMVVEVYWDSPAGGTSVVINVQGSDDNTNWNNVGTRTTALPIMRHRPARVSVSPNEYKYLRVSLQCTGTFTGSAQAYLNTYTGK